MLDFHAGTNIGTQPQLPLGNRGAQGFQAYKKLGVNLYKLHLEEVPLVAVSQVNLHIVPDLRNHTRRDVPHLLLPFQLLHQRLQSPVLLHDNQRIGSQFPIFRLHLHLEIVLLQRLIFQPHGKFFVFKLFQLLLHLLVARLLPKDIAYESSQAENQGSPHPDKDQSETVPLLGLPQLHLLFLNGSPAFQMPNLGQAVNLVQRVLVVLVAAQVKISTIGLMQGGKAVRHTLHGWHYQVDVASVHLLNGLAVTG